jgi:ferredoxin
MIAPETFELDDVDGHASAAHEEVPAEQREHVLQAVRSCPEQAIAISEEGRHER